MKSCLVVEDSYPVRKVACVMLSRLGFQTREAESAEQGLAMLQDGIPDLVLLDWNLPNKSGVQFLDELRRYEGGDAAKVIFCTSKDTSEDICHALARGADEYIMKPFDDRILASKLALVGLA
jgi:two-component system chemotaxis response regulator CheY